MRFWHNMLIAVACTLVTLIVIEVIFRVVFDGAQQQYIPRYFVVGDEHYPWCNPDHYSVPVHDGHNRVLFLMTQPNLSFCHQYPSNWNDYFDLQNRVCYRNNNKGFRGPDLLPDYAHRSKSLRQIVLLGDSFVWGEGVKLDDTLAIRIETLLNEAQPALPTKVFNLAMPGLNTHQEKILWEMHKSLVAPDLVVLGFNVNDVLLTEVQKQDDRKLKGRYVSMYKEATKPRSVFHSTFFRFVKHRIQRSLIESQMKEITVQDLHRKEDGRSAAELCRQFILELKNSCEEGGANFMIIVFPSFTKLDQNYPYEPIHELVGQIGQAEDIPVVDLLPLFRGKQSERFWVHPVDHHPNALAHKMISDYLVGNEEHNLLNVFDERLIE